MRGSKLAGAVTIAAAFAFAFVGCKSDEEHHRDKGPSTASTGSSSGAGGAGGVSSSEKGTTLEGTISKIDREKMLIAVSPSSGRESGELNWIDLSSCEFQNESGKKIESRGTELFGEGKDKLHVGQRVRVDYMGKRGTGEIGRGGVEAREVYQARRVTLLGE